MVVVVVVVVEAAPAVHALLISLAFFVSSLYLFWHAFELHFLGFALLSGIAELVLWTCLIGMLPVWRFNHVANAVCPCRPL